jgi:hypothetical protein
MALSANQLFLARDRVRNVLEAHLESQLALERANNIAQALVFEVEDPVEVALAMLRNEPIDNIDDVVQQVAEAWREKHTRERLKSCVQETLHAETDTDTPNTSRRYSEIREVNRANIRKKRSPSHEG